MCYKFNLEIFYESRQLLINRNNIGLSDASTYCLIICEILCKTKTRFSVDLWTMSEIKQDGW